MGLLKKIRASTLMETMVATVLIVLIFMMTSLLLNSYYSSHVQSNTQPLNERLYQLEYAEKHDLIVVPYTEEWNGWVIEVYTEAMDTSNFLVFEATWQKSGRKLTSYSANE